MKIKELDDIASCDLRRAIIESMELVLAGNNVGGANFVVLTFDTPEYGEYVSNIDILTVIKAMESFIKDIN